MNVKVLLTGGAGFIGHHFVEHFLKNTDWDIVVLDKLSYASNGLDRLRDIEAFDSHRVLVLTHDFSQRLSVGITKEIGEIDYIFHLGAESHVDNSIKDPEPFVLSNVLGTMHVLNFAREVVDLKCFLYFSTDEVFGPAPDNVNYKEHDRHEPSNPYSATKSGGEMLVKSYANTYRLPVIITRGMNCFGERQHPEKFIPTVIRKVLREETVMIHSAPNKIRSGSRFYIHARNVADAYLFLITKVVPKLMYSCRKPSINECYHIVGEKEISNLQLAHFIADVLKKTLWYDMVDFHSSRPGHDLRYALDGTKLANEGWTPPKNFEESLMKTVHWYVKHPRWLNL